MRIGYGILVACTAMALVGCESISKPYVMTVDRADQKVSGNRGYIKGTPPPAEDRTGLTRPLIAVDMDLVSIQGKATKPTTIITRKTATAAEEQTK